MERALPWREAALFFLLSASGHGSCVSGLFRFVLFIVGSERSDLVKTEGKSAGAEAEKGEEGEREGFFVFECCLVEVGFFSSFAGLVDGGEKKALSMRAEKRSIATLPKTLQLSPNSRPSEPGSGPRP